MKINLDDLIPEGMKLDVAASPQTEWSKYQTDFFGAVQDTGDNLVLEAVAGSGKTTTILEAMKRLGTKNVLFLAFNKSIQMELQARVPMGVTTKTLNALGHGVLSSRLQGGKLNSYKPHNILKEMLNDEVYRDYGFPLARILCMARHDGIGIRTDLSRETWEQFLLGGDMYVEASDAPRFAEILRRAFATMLDEYTTNFDFDDQLYMPIFHNMTFPQFDVVFIDEAQDLSYINHCQLVALQKRGARIIAVGDSRQAIYAFRGADSRSMANLADRFDARTLPLSICYRCDRLVVDEAKRLVPYIESAPTAAEGIITRHDEYPATASYEPKAMIMCRNNAPLMRLACQFLKERVPCHIIMDFAKELTKLIERMGVPTTVELSVKLEAWRKRETEKAISLRREHLIPIIDDKVDCILPFCEEFDYAIQVKGAIQNLTESKQGPRLSSIHKAKGLEADHAYILRPDLMPSQRALKKFQEYGDDSDLVQEDNLRYVAITRAKHHLHYLPGREQ